MTPTAVRRVPQCAAPTVASVEGIERRAVGALPVVVPPAGRATIRPRPARLLQLALFVTNELIAAVPSRALRQLWYRRVLGADLAAGAKLFMHVTVSVAGRRRARASLRVGRNSIVNQGVWLDARGGLRLGDDVNVSRGVWLLTADHDVDGPDLATRYASVEVGDRVFIGCRAIVLPGVRIGEGAVVAAGAVVTRDVPPYAVVAGVPARVLRTRRRDLAYELDYAPWLE